MAPRKKPALQVKVAVSSASCSVYASFAMTCPKCGSEAGWHGPTYKPGEYYMGNRRSEVGRLAYACNTCGYERLERTLNQIEVADPVWPDTPPPPLPGIDPGIDLSPAPRWLTAGWWRELNTWLFR